jgi:hypothetical protein
MRAHIIPAPHVHSLFSTPLYYSIYNCLIVHVVLECNIVVEPTTRYDSQLVDHENYINTPIMDDTRYMKHTTLEL